MRKKSSNRRKLRLESLEERRLLAVFTVDDDFTTNDVAARHYMTIQAAVNAASAGDKIKVRAGTYKENVVVSKQLTIKGADASLKNYDNAAKASIVDPVNNTATGGLGVAFDLQADGVKIDGFTIGEFDSNTDPDGTIGIRTSASHAGYKIKDNVIEKNTIGIYLNTSSSSTSTPAHTTVEDNVIRDNNRTPTNTGSSLTANAGNGIFSDQGLQNVKIEENRFTGANTTASIKVVAASGDTTSLRSGIDIEENWFSDVSGAGIYFEKVVDSVIDDNDLTNIALSGIRLNGGNERVTIKHNELKNPGSQNLFGIILSSDSSAGANQNNVIKKNRITTPGSTGVVIRDSSSNTIEYNRIKGNPNATLQFSFQGDGISLESADNSTLKRNRIENNARHGIYIDGNSNGNTLTRNVSKDNSKGVSGAFDYNDSTTGGTGPSNTQNTYQRNKGGTQNVTGLIAKVI